MFLNMNNLYGSLQKKGTIWYAVIEYKNDLGKRKQKWVTTKKEKKSEAQIVMRDILNRMENGTFVDNTIKIVFLDFLEDWFKKVLPKQVEKTTHESYTYTLESHIKPFFKEHYPNILLKDLKTEHFQKYFDYKLEKEKLTGNTLRKHKTPIKSCLDYAKNKKHYIPLNPIEDVVLPKKGKFIGKFYNTEQIEKLLQITKGTLVEIPTFITVYYGFRRGEALGLRWQDINFIDNTLTVCNTRVRCKTNTEKKPKTDKSFRTLPLIENVRNYLLEVKKTQEYNEKIMGSEYIKSDYICCWQTGKPIGTTYLNHKFSEVLKDNSMPHIRFHDLRHSTASFLLKQGFSLKEIQEWLGHSNISTTADLYTHIDMEQKKNIANKINNLFAIKKSC